MSRTALPSETTYAAVVGRILAGSRETRGLEQAEVARGVGVSQSTWSRIERGESALTVDQLARATAALATTPAQILAEADEAAANLGEMGITVRSDRNSKARARAMALLSGAVLSLAVARALSKSR